MTYLHLCPPGRCVSSTTFLLLYKDICLVRGHFAHYLSLLLSNITLFPLLCPLFFSVHHSASQVVKIRPDEGSVPSPRCPELLWGS